MAIRFIGKTSDEIFNVLEAYNSKVRRLNKIGGYITPKELTFSDIKAEVTTRNDLKRVLNSLRLYSKKGIEESMTTEGGFTTSKYHYELLKRKQRSAKTKITRRLNTLSKVKPTRYGVSDGEYTYAEMGDMDIENLRTRKRKLNRSIEKMSSDYLRDYEKYLDNVVNIDYSFRDKTYMNNYLNDMIFNLGYGAGVPTEQIEEIRRKIVENLSDNQIIKMMRSEESIRSLSEWYPVIHTKYGLNKGNIKLIRAEFDELSKNIDKIIETYRA